MDIDFIGQTLTADKSEVCFSISQNQMTSLVRRKQKTRCERHHWFCVNSDLVWKLLKKEISVHMNGNQAPHGS